MSQGDKLLLNYESPISVIKEYTDEIKYGWAQHKVWEVELFAGFPPEQLPESYDSLYLEFQFKMDVNGYSSAKSDSDWWYTQTRVAAFVNHPEKNKILQQITSFTFFKND